MSTRIRMILLHDGRYYAGEMARKMLEKICGYPPDPQPRIRGLDRIKKLFQETVQVFYKDRLWIFREPRRLKRERSKYMMFADYTGASKRVRRPVFQDEDGARMDGPAPPRFRRPAANAPLLGNAVAMPRLQPLVEHWPQRQIVDGRVWERNEGEFWHEVNQPVPPQGNEQ